MAAETGSEQSWGSGRCADDGTGVWAEVRLHRIYFAAVVAIVAITLLGANWAGQTPTQVGARSSSPAVVVEVNPSPGG